MGARGFNLMLGLKMAPRSNSGEPEKEKDWLSWPSSGAAGFGRAVCAVGFGRGPFSRQKYEQSLLSG